MTSTLLTAFSGLLTIIQGLVTSIGGLYVVRLFLGLAEVRLSHGLNKCI